jgi:hypothetical protein
MAFIVGMFLGARVRAFQSSIGWNLGSPSQLTVRLVDDPATGAAFRPVLVGTPVFFEFYGFRFAGLFQRWVETRGQDGNPVYEVTVVDPREILDGAQVIVGQYSGSVGSVKNLFNAFGYWEGKGFGQAQANEAGMPWYKIWQALVNIANTPSYGSFGGPLTFQGFAYSLDLGQLPGAPPYYRVGGGVSVSLLEAIAQVCEDGGCDFFVELVGFTIRVRTASRSRPPALGYISALANTNWAGTVIRSESGLECRNELTSAFLVGGEVTTLWLTGALEQFWGYSADGLPIKSQPFSFQVFAKQGFSDFVFGGPQLLGTVTTEIANLNATPVADLVGSLSYPCTVFEMRLAQAGPSPWALFMMEHRPQVAAMVGLTPEFRAPELNAGRGAAIRNDFVNDDVANAKRIAGGVVAGKPLANTNRLYEFVRGYADEFLGKKFLAGLPFILTKTEPETLKVTTSWEVADGGYLAEGSAPLGLSPLNEDQFKTPDGRFRSFAVFAGTRNIDFTRVSAQGAVVENDLLYMEAQVDPRIVSDDTPKVVVTLNGPVYEQPTDNVGDVSLAAAAVRLSPQEFQRRAQQAVLPIKIAPAVLKPGAAAVPLKSNVLTYGPWSAAGAAGKVRVDHDPSLTPWGYGTYGAMNAAAASRVNTAVTAAQVVETGRLDRAGAPEFSLGDVIDAGGPLVTNIDVSYGQEGVSTSYRFQTFTPKFGLFARGTAERIKRMGLASLELRRSLRVALRDRMLVQEAASDARRAARGFQERQAKAHKRETPYDVLHCFGSQDYNDSSVRTHVSLGTFEETVAMSNAHDNNLYQQTAIMGMNGLVRPFVANKTSSFPSGVMPAGFESSQFQGLQIYPGAGTLNPFRAKSDIEVFAFGTSYQGLHAYRRQSTNSVLTDVRALGLRAPLVLVGWGFDIKGARVPGSGTVWDQDALYRQDKWRAGPLDALWDPNRGVWTFHTQLAGTLGGTIPGGGSGDMTVFSTDFGGGSFNSYHQTVWNWFTAPITVPSGSNLRVMANYVAGHNKYYVTAADCI